MTTTTTNTNGGRRRHYNLAPCDDDAPALTAAVVLLFYTAEKNLGLGVKKTICVCLYCRLGKMHDDEECASRFDALEAKLDAIDSQLQLVLSLLRPVHKHADWVEQLRCKLSQLRILPAALPPAAAD